MIREFGRRAYLVFFCAMLLLVQSGHAQLSSQVPDPAQQASGQATQANVRTALVIGNADYKYAALANPVNDARDIAKALSNLGFTVALKENTSLREMKQAIRDFAARIKKGGTGLVYFAGHGVQSKGKNYLIPIDADIQQEYELEDQAVDANLILGAMDEAQNAANILILDACRNNPFARSFRSASSGLAQMDAAKGTLIAYATAPGSVAADGADRNGTYTKHLLQSLQYSDSDISRVFARVRAGVVKETNGRQVPWESTSLIGDFYFDPAQARNNSGEPSKREALQISPLALELSFWESVQASKIKADFEAYLASYPQGQYAALARNRIAAFSQSPASAGNNESRTPAGVATVVFYRPTGFVGWGASSIVLIKGRELGQLPNGSYFTAQVPAGTQVVSIEHAEWAGSRVFDFEAGATYFIKLEYSLGQVGLRLAKEEEAKNAMRSLPNSALTSNK